MKDLTQLDLKKIKNSRKLIKLSQQEIGEKIGLNSGKSYHERESGKIKFSADELARLAIIFGVDISTLYAENFFANTITDSVIFPTPTPAPDAKNNRKGA